jgi:hypothetical protein
MNPAAHCLLDFCTTTPTFSSRRFFVLKDHGACLSLKPSRPRQALASLVFNRLQPTYTPPTFLLPVEVPRFPSLSDFPTCRRPRLGTFPVFRYNRCLSFGVEETRDAMSAYLQMRDASGRRVSLLNEEDTQHQHPLTRPSPMSFPSFERQAPPAVSTPATPELLRSNSYDSQRGAEPISPITPIYDPGYQYTPASGLEIRLSYEEYPAERQFSDALERRPSYDGDLYTTEAAPSPTTGPNIPQGGEKPPRRHACRYRDELRCYSTFTTSGHASRHAKIHTAEKAVPCEYPGCTKKFTRTDNMKQHLETHYKGKSRSARSGSVSKRERRASAARRRSVSPQSLSPTGDPADQRARMAIEAEAYAGARVLPHLSLRQAGHPYHHGQALAMAQAAPTSPTTTGPSNSTRGLDALASVALQQGGQ